MVEAVIVSTARSPIGRARKGSLTEIRAGELAAQMIGASLVKVPKLNTNDVDDSMLNCGVPEGDPFGMTGARITSTPINSLRHHDKHIGLETMCVGGGMGMAIALERLN